MVCVVSICTASPVCLGNTLVQNSFQVQGLMLLQGWVCASKIWNKFFCCDGNTCILLIFLDFIILCNGIMEFIILMCSPNTNCNQFISCSTATDPGRSNLNCLWSQTTCHLLKFTISQWCRLLTLNLLHLSEYYTCVHRLMRLVNEHEVWKLGSRGLLWWMIVSSGIHDTWIYHFAAKKTNFDLSKVSFVVQLS